MNIKQKIKEILGSIYAERQSIFVFGAIISFCALTGYMYFSSMDNIYVFDCVSGNMTTWQENYTIHQLRGNNYEFDGSFWSTDIKNDTVIEKFCIQREVIFKWK